MKSMLEQIDDLNLSSDHPHNVNTNIEWTYYNLSRKKLNHYGTKTLRRFSILAIVKCLIWLIFAYEITFLTDKAEVKNDRTNIPIKVTLEDGSIREVKRYDYMLFHMNISFIIVLLLTYGLGTYKTIVDLDPEIMKKLTVSNQMNNLLNVDENGEFIEDKDPRDKSGTKLMLYVQDHITRRNYAIQNDKVRERNLGTDFGKSQDFVDRMQGFNKGRSSR